MWHIMMHVTDHVRTRTVSLTCINTKETPIRTWTIPYQSLMAIGMHTSDPINKKGVILTYITTCSWDNTLTILMTLSYSIEVHRSNKECVKSECIQLIVYVLWALQIFNHRHFSYTNRWHLRYELQIKRDMESDFLSAERYAIMKCMEIKVGGI